MALGSCFNCIKYLMFIFNFIFWVLGCALLGVGLWVKLDPNFSEAFDDEAIKEYSNLLYKMAYVIIAVGVIVMVIGFLGCCGAVRESQCMLATFFVFLFLIFVVLIGASIWAVMQRDDLKAGVKKGLQDKVDNYQGNATRVPYLEALQDRLECCGAEHGVTDYNTYENDARSFCPAGTFTTPCAEKVIEEFRSNMVIVVGIAIGIGVIMLLGMVFSMLLCCAIREATA